MVERVFKSLREIKEAYFPNRSLEDLEGEQTVEQMREDLLKVIGRSRKEREIDSKKLPK